MKSALTTLACLSLTVGIAHAQSQAQTAPAPAQPKKSSSERLICRQDYETGSIVHKKRICLTAAQWRQATMENGQEFERHVAQRSGLGSR